MRAHLKRFERTEWPGTERIEKDGIRMREALSPSAERLLAIGEKSESTLSIRYIRVALTARRIRECYSI